MKPFLTGLSDIARVTGLLFLMITKMADRYCLAEHQQKKQKSKIYVFFTIENNYSAAPCKPGSGYSNFLQQMSTFFTAIVIVFTALNFVAWLNLLKKNKLCI